LTEVLAGLAFLAGLAMAPRWVSAYFDRARAEGQELDWQVYATRMRRNRVRLALAAFAALALAAGLRSLDGGGMISVAILAFTAGAAIVALYAAAKCTDRFN
jgi:hypothetical protein